MNDVAGIDYAGIDRFSARKMIRDKLESEGLLMEEEPYQNNVGFSERADVPIEPRLSEQWFLKYPRVEEAKKVVKEGHIKFFPERWTKTYLHWMDNIQDWCISRQLWWGHRIPVWYRKEKYERILRIGMSPFPDHQTRRIGSRMRMSWILGLHPGYGP